MDTIRKWTSPTQELRVEGIDLTEADVYVTFAQDSTTMTFTESDGITVELDDEDTVITIPLTQETTGAFTSSPIKVQVNWLQDGERNATDIAYFRPTDNLYEELIE